jgi:hypothetical protein
MTRDIRRFVPMVTALTALIVLPALSARAQQAPADARVRTRPAAEVLTQLGRSAGVVILADSTVQGRLPEWAQPSTPEAVEQQLAAMVRLLPAGTTWARLYVPAPANGRWVGDLVADYARAQARLVGATGREAPAGTVELLGRYVPETKANEYIAALNLKLVYLVTNSQAPAASTVAGNWSRLTPEQRDQYSRQQAQRLMSLDPSTRLQALRQMMAAQQESPVPSIMKMVMSQLSDDERVQLKQFMSDGRRPGSGK